MRDKDHPLIVTHASECLRVYKCSFSSSQLFLMFFFGCIYWLYVPHDWMQTNWRGLNTALDNLHILLAHMESSTAHLAHILIPPSHHTFLPLPPAVGTNKGSPASAVGTNKVPPATSSTPATPLAPVSTHSPSPSSPMSPAETRGGTGASAAASGGGSGGRAAGGGGARQGGGGSSGGGGGAAGGGLRWGWGGKKEGIAVGAGGQHGLHNSKEFVGRGSKELVGSRGSKELVGLHSSKEVVAPCGTQDTATHHNTAQHTVASPSVAPARLRWGSGAATGTSMCSMLLCVGVCGGVW